MGDGIKIKLIAGGAMVAYLPEDYDKGNSVWPCTQGASVQDILDQLDVPPDQPLMVILNDTMVTRTSYSETLLSDRDTLSLMPPITAG